MIDQKGFLKQLWQRCFLIWKIQLDIVSVFLLLICSSSLIIFFFTYQRNHTGMLDLSKTLIQQASKAVIDNVSRVTDQAELLAKATKGLITTPQAVTENNSALLSYLFNALISEPLISRITIATQEGVLISTSNLSLSHQSHYFLNRMKPLPSGAKFALRIINPLGHAPGEYWEYKNTDLLTLTTENLSSVPEDPRTEEWYSRVSNWPHLRWSSHLNSSSLQPQVTVSVPVTDSKRAVFAVISMDLSLDYLSNQLSFQQIGKNGKAFILDNKGTLIVPEASLSSSALNPSSLFAEELYIHSQQLNKETFLIQHSNIEYLVNIADFPLDSETKWLIVVVAPFNDFFGPILTTQNQTILISLAILCIFAILVYFISKHISSPIVKLEQAVNKIQQFDFEEPLPIKSHIAEIIALNSSIKTMRLALRSFSRYVPKEIVKTLIQQGQEITLGGERRDLTIMFSDIENFSTLSESLSIEKLTLALSAYFDKLSQLIMKCEGTIDKYIGDSVMAFWNAPKQILDHADKACIATLLCLKATQQQAEANPLLQTRTRFGIHSGEVIVGNIGTQERMNYSAIGNVVNTTARLQSLNKQYRTSILISESVHEKIAKRFITRPLDFIVVKGRTKGITVFELVGVKGGYRELVPHPEEIELCEAFTQAFELFHSGKVEEAKKNFLDLQQKFPNDTPIQIYLERLSKR